MCACVCMLECLCIEKTVKKKGDCQKIRSIISKLFQSALLLQVLYIEVRFTYHIQKRIQIHWKVSEGLNTERDIVRIDIFI